MHVTNRTFSVISRRIHIRHTIKKKLTTVQTPIHHHNNKRSETSNNPLHNNIYIYSSRFSQCCHLMLVRKYIFRYFIRLKSFIPEFFRILRFIVIRRLKNVFTINVLNLNLKR